MPVTQITKDSPVFLREILIKGKTKTQIVDDNAEIFLHITNIDPNHNIPDVSFSTTDKRPSIDVKVSFDLKAGREGPLACKVRMER